MKDDGGLPTLAPPPGDTAASGNGAARAAEGAPAPTERGPRRWPRRLAAAVALAAALLLAALAVPRLLEWLGPAEPPGVLLASGRIEGRITTLSPTASAWVARLHVDEGQAVTAGQLLATLDDPAQRQRVRSAEEQLQALGDRLRAADRRLATTERQVALEADRAAAEVREAQARLQRARASHRQAARDAERVAILAARDLVAVQEAEHARLRAVTEEEGVREAEAAVASADQQLGLARLGPQQVEAMRADRDALARERRQAEAQLAEQRSHVADFAVRSPGPGRILTRTVERGERVEQGTPLFSLVDLDRLYVKVYVPEPSVGKVALGQEARVHVDAYPDRAFAARVSRVAQEAEFTPKNVETREERVKLVFAVEVALVENPGGVLKPGMPADVVIRSRADAPWVLPAGARAGAAPAGATPAAR